MHGHLRVNDVAPRDGLQNEHAHIGTADKLSLVDGLVQAGVRSIELTSFVSPRAVPQMADAADVAAAALARYPDVTFSALIFNKKGYDRAVAAGVSQVNIVLVLTEALSQSNACRSVADSLAATLDLMALAKAGGVNTRVYLAAAWECPYEGAVDPDHVLRTADTIWAAQPDELCFTDPAGLAGPQQVGTLMTRAVAAFGPARLAVHLHDTQALGSANLFAALQAGIRSADSSVGGLGGCPFTPGSTGNLATEDVVLLADKLGLTTGIDYAALWPTVTAAEQMVGRTLGGRSRQWWEAACALADATP